MSLDTTLSVRNYSVKLYYIKTIACEKALCVEPASRILKHVAAKSVVRENI